ncbi:MAG: glycosyltransferase, partial [Desulfobacteraceae bacterium]|nr:glycosyltransferase [Desulfobacteraceae bacterium]
MDIVINDGTIYRPDLCAGDRDLRPECSVLVVNYNGGDLVAACVKAVLASSIRVEVLVWDNASADGSAEALA